MAVHGPADGVGHPRARSHGASEEMDRVLDRSLPPAAAGALLCAMIRILGVPDPVSSWTLPVAVKRCASKKSVPTSGSRMPIASSGP